MSLVVVGTDGPIARALDAAEPPARLGAIVSRIDERQPTELVFVALPEPIGPVGALPTEELADLLERTVTAAFVAAKLASQLPHDVRIAVVCTADGVLPDHRDGARSVAAAGLTMLSEVCSAVPNLTMNTIAVADDVPPEEVVATVRFALAGGAASLNGATIRLDGGRDAVLAGETRA